MTENYEDDILYPQELGKYINTLMLDVGYKNSTQLADAVGCDLSTIGKIISGERQPSPKLMKRLSRVLHTSVGVFYHVLLYGQLPAEEAVQPDQVEYIALSPALSRQDRAIFKALLSSMTDARLNAGTPGNQGLTGGTSASNNLKVLPITEENRDTSGPTGSAYNRLGEVMVKHSLNCAK